MIKSRRYILKSTPITDLFITQNPADSGIAVLYTGEGGVKMVTLDRELNVVDSIRVISATTGKTGRAAAVVRADLYSVRAVEVRGAESNSATTSTHANSAPRTNR